MAIDTTAPAGQAIPEPPNRLIRLLLGRPRRTDEEQRERLSNPLALAVLSSDALSSVAYANEEMLRVLLPVAAAASFALVLPISGAIILLLLTLVFSYRQTIKAYPTAGGAYIVTRDNFGVLPAQVAGVSLLLDYIMTVAVSVAAGVAALYSVYPSLFAIRVPLAIGLVWLMTWGNLRGARASGRLFAAPTYLFMVAVFGLLATAMLRLAAGGLHRIPAPQHLASGDVGAVGLFVIAHAYASGTTALTGVEAISNGVPIFRPVEWRNARLVLTWMGVLLAAMFAGLSVLTWKLHPIPNDKRTLVYQLGRAAFGSTGLGGGALLLLQVATTAVLILAANTSFADFPRLASFHAADGYLPAPFRVRGRRLSYSYGILALAVIASLVTLIFGADVHRLIPLYAVGAFASFTFSQAGMTRRHLRLREEGWRHSLVINGLGATGSGLAMVAVIVTKFSHGAWAVLVLIPCGVRLFVGIHRHYERLDHLLADPGPEETRPSGLAVEVADDDGDVARTARLLFSRAPADPGPRPVEAVVLPRAAAEGALPALARRFRLAAERRRLRRQIGVVLVELPRCPATCDDPVRLAAVVVVDAADVLARRAIEIGELLVPQELHVVHVDRDRDATDALLRGWQDHSFGHEVEVLTAPYREATGPLEWKASQLHKAGNDVVAVVVAELVPRWWQKPLHESHAGSIAAVLTTCPFVAVLEVPFPMHGGGARSRQSRSPLAAPGGG